MPGAIQDVITPANFSEDRLRGSGIVTGRIFILFHSLASFPLQHSHYHASVWYIGLGLDWPLRQKPITTFYYDVFLLRSVHGRSKRLRKPLLTVFGKFDPLKCGRTSPWPTKGTWLLARVLSHFPSKSIYPGKNKNKNNFGVISRIWPVVTLWPIGTNFGLRVCLVDRNGVEVLPFSLDCDLAVNTSALWCNDVNDVIIVTRRHVAVIHCNYLEERLS